MRQNDQTLEVDSIVVGQGLAGTILAHDLLENNCSIAIIDKSELSQASKVAAGIWNPVVFKRLTQSWMIDELLPVLKDRYENIARKLEANTFLFPKRYFKIITSEEEESFWEKKANSEMKTYLSNSTFEDQRIGQKVGEVFEAGHLDIHRFLMESRSYFQKNAILLNQEFTFEQFEFDKNQIKYKNILARNIIFCEGHRIHKNPYFKFIPFKPVKGEVITLKCENLNTDAILNKGVFILPLPEKNHYKVGATYDWDNLDDHPSEKGINSLLEKMKSIHNYPYEIVKKEAGVRPSILDRRPVIGEHPIHKNLWVFNGLGTKGVMLAPYFSNQITKAILKQEEISPSVHISRFFMDFKKHKDC